MRKRALVVIGLLAVIIIITLFTFSWCDEEPISSVYDVEKSVINLELVMNFGNLSYITLNLSGTPQENFQAIAFALSAWEEAHPDLVIVDIEIDRIQDSMMTSPSVLGIIIYHQSE